MTPEQKTSRERRVPVRTVMVRMGCASCEGEMRRTEDPILMSSPEQFPHQCDRCGKREYFPGQVYPHLAHEELSHD